MSGSSLKGYIPALAVHLGKSPAALYERQRALVRADLLEFEEGRGPGSGVRTTSQSVALLIIAVLATDNLSDTAERTQAIVAAKATKQTRQTMMGVKTLVDQLAAMFACAAVGNGPIHPAMEGLRVALTGFVELVVSRTAPYATVVYQGGAAEFGERTDAAPIQVTAAMGRETFLRIAGDVCSILTEGTGSYEQQAVHEFQIHVAPDAASGRRSTRRRRSRAP
jgi:hypothetical protein